jgi:hypothetical protein
VNAGDVVWKCGHQRIRKREATGKSEMRMMDGRKSFREQLCRKARVESSVRKVEEARMRWFGHLIRMDGYNYKEYHCETASYRQRGQKMWHRKQMWSALPPPPPPPPFIT